MNVQCCSSESKPCALFCHLSSLLLYLLLPSLSYKLPFFVTNLRKFTLQSLEILANLAFFCRKKCSKKVLSRCACVRVGRKLLSSERVGVIAKLLFPREKWHNSPPTLQLDFTKFTWLLPRSKRQWTCYKSKTKTIWDLPFCQFRLYIYLKITSMLQQSIRQNSFSFIINA